MRKYASAILTLLLLFSPLHALFAANDPNDVEGSRDPALFNRMPGFHIENYEEREFDNYEFPAGPDEKTISVEGHFFSLEYYPNEGAKIPSGLQIVRNFVNAAKSVGGEVVYEWDDGRKNVTLKIANDIRRTWAVIEANEDGEYYGIKMVEEQLMNQDVAANAESLASSINTTGRAAVYGIYFDTGKAELKPESEPALSEMVKLLKNNAQLKLYVVGHTDTAGQFDYNLKISQQRAAAVVQALANKGISASRLTSFGAGPVAPVASNSSEEGKAKNRRVELVSQ